MESTNPSKAQTLEDIIFYAEWKAYEIERERFLKERYRRIDGRYKPINHGTRSGYMRGCRCDECLKGAADWMREYRHRKGINQPRTKGNFTHGTWYGYSRGKCRCDLCEPVGVAHNAKYRARKKQRREEARKQGLTPD